MPKYRNHTFEDVCRQGYAEHIHAMTAEELYSKADIAEELTVRDSEIASLKQQLAEAQAELAAVERDAVGLLKAEYYRGYSDREQEVRDGIGAYGHPIGENIKENERLERENEELRQQLEVANAIIQEQRQSIGALNMCIGGEGSTTTDNLVRVSRLEYQLAEAQRDAARYHHVLKLLCTDNDKAVVDTFVQMPFEVVYPTPDEFTAAIDQAMKEE